MGLKFRRGTTAEKSGSLAFGEPYVNTTLGTLQIGGTTGDITLSTSGTGSTGNFGTISGSGLDITGNANIAGNLTLGGAITIGDATADTVNVVASLSSSLIPQSDSIFDLGSATKSWRDLYISTGSIKVVANGTVVSTLSTNADGSQTFPNGLYSQANILIGSGSYNSGAKFEVGRRGDIPDFNVILGLGIMPNLTSGESNVGIGRLIFNDLKAGFNNIGIGDGAGYGISGSAQNNITIGYGAAYFLTGSNVANNIFIGTESGRQCNNGFSNVAIGTNTLMGVSDANDNFTKNTALGHQAGAYATGASSNNIYLGANSGPTSSIAETQKFYVGRGEVGQTPFMLGTMTSFFPSLEINAQVVTISGSVLPNTTDVFQLGSTSKMWKNVIATSISGAIAATNGVVSGSSQITYADISSIPAGIVSGSSQVTLSSTTGYGSVLNQAVLTTSSPTFAGLTINGAITATGDITAYYTSDKRHKHNIVLISDALSKVTKLNGVTWEWNDDVNEVTKSTPNTGLIAQEVQEVLPEVVKEREDGFLALDYSKMMGLMIEAIKEQQKQIDSLLIKINQLENK
jgi:hypothetical protein